MRRLPNPGDHVLVPWGLDSIEGEVIDADDSGIGGHVLVEVRLEGMEEPMTVTFPLDAVEPADAA